MRQVPYFTTEDDTQYCGHVWRQRDSVGGRWGFAWEVLSPWEEEIASGWRLSQEEAELVMSAILSQYPTINKLKRKRQL